MRVSKQAKEAMDKAEKEVRKQAKKKVKRRPKKKPINYESLGLDKEEIKKEEKLAQEQRKTTQGKWIVDEWGDQGEVYFDGKLYWILDFIPKGDGIYEVVSKGLSEESWENYKKHPLRLESRLTQSRTEKRSQKSETSETGKQSSSTQRKTKSTKPSKGKRSGKSPTKSGKTSTQMKQRKWQ